MSTKASTSLARRIATRLAFAAALVVILAAVAVGGFRLLVNRLPGYQNDLQAWVSRELGLTLGFSRVDARWGLSGPELTFADVSLGAAGYLLARDRDPITPEMFEEALKQTFHGQRLEEARAVLEKTTTIPIHE